MAKLLYALMAQRVLTDRDTGNVSYIEVMEGFNVPTLPATLPAFTISSVWENDADKQLSLLLRVTIFGPDNNGVGNPFDVVPQPIAARKRHRVNLAFAGFPANIAGDYRIRLEQKLGAEWAEAGQLTLSVVYNPPKPQVVIQTGTAKQPSSIVRDL